MRTAKVLYKNEIAGTLTDTESAEGYLFQYDPAYLEKDTAKPVSLTLPLQENTFKSKILFPFFDGLIPEGWLLNIAVKNWKINQRDRFGLLLVMCNDCIGCVSIETQK